jgi:pectin methylesterase-like acyl-CoA thioesterase
MNRRSAPIQVLAIVGLAFLANAGVIVVDATGGGDFTQIQPAIDAAVDGDTIYVKRTGLYASFTVDDKALSVVGHDNPLWPDVTGTIEIKNRVPEDPLVQRCRSRRALRVHRSGSCDPRRVRRGIPERCVRGQHVPGVDGGRV